MHLTPKYQRAFERAKKNKYLKFSTGKTNALEDAFYKWCEDDGYPLIKVLTGHKYADIKVDMVTTELTLSDELRDDYQRLYNSYRGKKVLLKSTPQLCYFEKIPMEDVDKLVQEIISFLPFAEL